MNMNVDGIIVHDGTFHADDVLCVSFLQLFSPKLSVRRLSKKELPHVCPRGTVIADIGLGKYDHHQEDAVRRKDGKKHAACGLLLADYYQMVYPAGVPRELETYISAIEDYDNKVEGSDEDCITKYVRLCNPEWDDDQSRGSYDKAFLNAAAVVREHFLRPFIHAPHLPDEEMSFINNQIRILSDRHSRAEKRAEEQIIKAYDHSDHLVVVLPLRMPWYNYLIPTNALFVINPSNRGGYHLQCIPSEIGKNKFKLLLPKLWLKDMPVGCSFVHPELFIAAFITQEDAISAANSIIKML